MLLYHPINAIKMGSIPRFLEFFTESTNLPYFIVFSESRFHFHLFGDIEPITYKKGTCKSQQMKEC